MITIIENKSYFILQYRSKRRTGEWKDYQLYTTLEHANTMYSSAINSGLDWWKNKNLRIIHRTITEETIPPPNDQ